MSIRTSWSKHDAYVAKLSYILWKLGLRRVMVPGKWNELRSGNDTDWSRKL